MKIIGSVLILVGILMFWFLFFVAAPFVCHAVPIGEWKALMDIIIYAVIGYFFGGAVPLVLVIYGLVAIFIGD